MADSQRRWILKAMCATWAGAVAHAAPRPSDPSTTSASTITSTFEARVLTSGDSDATRQIVAALGARLPLARFDSDLKALRERRGRAVYVAVGPSALKALVDSDIAAPILSLFCSNETFTRIANESHPSRGAESLTAIYAEASPQAQMQLARTIRGRHTRLGVLLGERTRHLQPSLESAASDWDIDLTVLLIPDGNVIARAVAKLTQAEFILTVPDRSIYTPDSVRDLLDASYRQRQGVIGYSGTLVRAGALAAAYPSLNDIAAQLGATLDDLGSGRGFARQYPRYWRVAVNDSVSQSLNISIGSAARQLGNFPPPT
ncbi:hypothetical protein [Burkholderia gladioli]|uniref:hypothetical protein n=1 Tax=Burkholderia gladioli TaxID=28095 RepID=UPI001640D348|nr:hypothetical protein [Burkholderia gladioli]